MSIRISATTAISDYKSFKKVLIEVANCHGAEAHFNGSDAVIEFCRLGSVLVGISIKDKSLLATFKAVTSYAGAGFHHAVIVFLDDISKHYKLEVRDNINYFEDRNFERIKNDVFIKSMVMTTKLFGMPEEILSPMLSANTTNYKPKHIEGSIATYMGRFNAEKLINLANNDKEAFSNIFFIWGNIEKDAIFYKNTAMNLLWEEIHFYENGVSELEDRLASIVISSLEKAVKIDPLISIPKEEYLALCSIHNKESISLENISDHKSDYKIGYLRDEVLYSIDKVSMVIDGEFLIHSNDEDNDIVLYTPLKDTKRVVHISAYHTFESKASFMNEVFGESDTHTINIGEGSCRFAYVGSNIHKNYNCHNYLAQVIYENRVVIFNICSFDESQSDWAISFINNLEVR